MSGCCTCDAAQSLSGCQCPCREPQLASATQSIGECSGAACSGRQGDTGHRADAARPLSLTSGRATCGCGNSRQHLMQLARAFSPPVTSVPRVVARTLMIRDRDGMLLDSHDAGSEVIEHLGIEQVPFFERRRTVGAALEVTSDLIEVASSGTVRVERHAYLQRVHLRPFSQNISATATGGTTSLVNADAPTSGDERDDEREVFVFLTEDYRVPTAKVRFRATFERAGVLADATRFVDSRVMTEREFARRTLAICAAVQSIGGTIIQRLPSALAVQIRIAPSAEGHLRNLPGVRTVRAAAGKTAPDDYTCTGSPTRAISGIDGGACTPSSRSGQPTFLDGIRDVVGASAFWTAGYRGSAAGGNTDEDAIVVGVVDKGFNLEHPAWGGPDHVSRVLGVYSAEWDASGPDGLGPTGWRDPLEGTPLVSFLDHGSRTAAVIGADLRHGQDAQSFVKFGVNNRTGRLARTGIAPEVMFRLYEYSYASMQYRGTSVADALGAAADPAIDVLNWSGSTSEDGVHSGEEDARGQSAEAELINALFRENGVLVVKSGGNIETYLDAAQEQAQRLYNIGGPAASCLLSVGTLSVSGSPPIDALSAGLTGGSAGDRTPDGRTFPSLVAVGANCGCFAGVEWPSGFGSGYSASDMTTFDGVDASVIFGTTIKATWKWYSDAGLFGDDPFYGGHGASSATAPKVSGSAALLKSWYLTHFGDHANQPGRLMANLLNMTDRYVKVDQLQPYPFWGTGRFRLRAWGSDWWAGVGAGRFQTSRVVLGTDEAVVFDIGDASTGQIPKDVQRLNILAWWDEPNTGEDAADGSFTNQEKAVFYLFLFRGATLIEVAISDNDNGGESMVSMAFDNASDRLPCIDGGETFTLELGAVNVPVAAFGRVDFPDVSGLPEGPVVLLNTREVFISIVWESTDDISRPSCSTAVATSCDDRLVNYDVVSFEATGAQP